MFLRESNRMKNRKLLIIAAAENFQSHSAIFMLSSPAHYSSFLEHIVYVYLFVCMCVSASVCVRKYCYRKMNSFHLGSAEAG